MQICYIVVISRNENKTPISMLLTTGAIIQRCLAFVDLSSCSLPRPPPPFPSIGRSAFLSEGLRDKTSSFINRIIAAATEAVAEASAAVAMVCVYY